MSRLMLKSMLAVLVVAGAGPFILPLKDGKPLLSLSDLKAPPLPEVPFTSFEIGGTSEPASNAPVVVYRWKVGGEWNYSDEPPAEGTPYETVRTWANANVVPAEPVAKRAPAGAAGTAAGTEPGRSPANPIEVSPMQMVESLQKAAQLQETIDQHKALQDRQLEGLR